MQQDNLPDELGTLEEKAEAPLKSTGRISTALPKVWVGYIIAAVFLIVEVGEVIIDPTTAERATILPIAIYLGGWIYWLFCVHRMHKVIAEATDFYHPVTPGQAVGYHFIPFYNFYWIFKWPNEIADFVNTSRVVTGRVRRSDSYPNVRARGHSYCIRRQW